MAYASLGQHEEARQWFDKAKATMKTLEPSHVELAELRDQAEQLLHDRAASASLQTSAGDKHDSS
jgi:hypothetical protein